MAPPSLSLAFLLLLLFASSSSAGDVDASSTGISPTGAKPPQEKAVLGGREKVPDVESNTEVQSLGRFCVDEYNKKQAKGALRFRRVFEAERQVVSGMKYYLKIEAEARGVKKEYDAVVVVKAWLHSREMLSFEPAARR
ncbi:hypothetical protein ACLOJK_008171 [Asimina triloba]